ncbi:MAG: rhodanese-like domain-containing protein [Deltaproteobacteria bacterium]|nr:rhodanese-like domain-containing protein [Deltaproteobacteria bacterium]
MKKICLVLNAVFILTLFLCQTALAADYQRITSKEFKSIQKDGSPSVIVDVREPELYSKGHIPGAINIPYDTAKGRILKELSPKDRIVFVCHGGPMGDELAEILAKKGYTNVYNIKGGMWAWDGPLTVK